MPRLRRSHAPCRLPKSTALTLLAGAVLHLMAFPSHAETTPNLLVNGDGELGNLTGWGNAGSAVAQIDNGAFNLGIFPAGGFYDFVGGNGGSVSRLFQQLFPTSYQIPFPLIDANQVTFHISYFEQSLNQSPADTASVVIHLFDATPAVIANTGDTPLAFLGSWGTSSFDVAARPTTRSIQYIMVFNLNSGSDIDSYIDNNSLTASYAGSAWNGSAGNHLWTAPANWNTGLPAPGTAAVLTRLTGSDSVTLDTSYPSPLSFLIVDAPTGMILNQSANAMAATSQFIGYAGTGTYNQSGGTNTAGTLTLAPVIGGAGTYNLSGGTLTAAAINVGGAFNMSGGIATADTLHTLNNGHFNLSGGTLTVGELASDFFNAFAFTGGTLNVTRIGLIIDGSSLPANLTLKGIQSMNLTGATTFSINNIAGSNVGLLLFTSPASLVQNDASSVTVGTPGVPRNLDLAYAPGTISYTLNGPASSLTVYGNMYLGGNESGATGNTGNFIINGSATITDTLRLWKDSAIFLNNGSLNVSVLDFASPASSFHWAGGTLTLLNGYINGLPAFTVPATGTLAGSGALVSAITLNGAIALSHLGDDLSIHGTVSGPGNISVAANTSLTADSLLINTLSVSGFVRIRPGSNNPVKLNSIVIAGTPGNWTGKLDLTTNALILQTPPLGKSSILAGLANLIASAKSGGPAGGGGTSWTGNGITSSTVALDPAHLTIALADNADLHFTSFRGQSVDGNSLLITQAPFGDANLDGKVDAFDLNLLAAHWQQQSGALWSAGDFTGDGKVDAFDLNVLAANWQFGTAAAAAPLALPTAFASVPEPATLASLTLAAAFRPRRRSQHQ